MVLANTKCKGNELIAVNYSPFYRRDIYLYIILIARARASVVIGALKLTCRDILNIR